MSILLARRGIMAKQTVSGATDWASVVAADTPLAWLRLNETSGTTAADSSGNARNFTYLGSGGGGVPTLNVAGKGTDKAVTFTAGTTDRAFGNIAAVGAGFSTASTSAAETWAAEITVKATASTPNNSYFISVGNSASDNAIIGININSSRRFTGVYPTDNVSFINNISAPSGTHDDSAFHHVVWECDGTTVRLWVDNVEVVNAAAATGAVATFDRASVGNLHRSTEGSYTTATVDEAVWYDHALGATRIGVHYTAFQAM